MGSIMNVGVTIKDGSLTFFNFMRIRSNLVQIERIIILTEICTGNL